jgi:DNA-binding ferritin-like protein (Dps family)
MELIGPDVAAFADGLIADSPTYADAYQESLKGK